MQIRPLTQKEAEALLMLFKDFNIYYNANSISKRINITPRGALKILKHLKDEGLVNSKKLGKATFYKVNLDDHYTFRTIETLLIQESRFKAGRWANEFKELLEYADIAIIYGGIINKSSKTNDIDLILVLKNGEYKKIMRSIENKNKILIKPIHPIILSIQDLENNLNNANEVIINAIRTGYTLHGYDKLIEVIKNVTSF